VILRFYTPAEISSAKKLLVSKFAECPSDCALKTERRNSSSRSIHDAEVEDICGLFQHLDNNNELSRVVFAAVDHSRMPKYGPEELNIGYISDKQAELNVKVDKLSGRVNEVMGSLSCSSSSRTRSVQPYAFSHSLLPLRLSARNVYLPPAPEL